MKKLFKNVSAIVLALCMALSASAVALAGGDEGVYTPFVDTETTVYNWSDAYGKEGYILLGDGSGIIYSNLYQNDAYVKNADLTDHATTKDTTNKILGGMYADVYNNYRGYYYAFSQGAKALEVIEAQGGTSLTDNAGRTAMNASANADAKADLTTNGKCDGGLLSTAPISSWGISGTDWSNTGGQGQNTSGHTRWTTPAGEVINVRVQSNKVAYPYTVAFTITEDAVKDGRGIYVTVRTYRMTGGDVMLKNAWYANNDDKSIAAGSAAAIQTVSVTGDGFVTFYITAAGDYTVVANDLNSQEGITGIFFDKSEPTPVAMYDAVGFDSATKANWEGAYGNAGYVIYAGNSTTDRYVYTKNIFAGDSEGDYSKLDAWPVSTDNPSKESNYHPFKVNGADPDGTIISQFNDQTYNVQGHTTPAAGLYLPGSLDINKYMTKAASAAAPSAVAFYVPAQALSTAKDKTGESVIYVSMYIPGESATRSAEATTTVKMVYSPSENIVDLAPKALNSGSATNDAGGLLFNTDKTTLKSPSATLAASQTYTFTEGDANGVYVTFELRGAGYYAIQNIDTVESGTWSGIFFDYEKPVANESSASHVSTVKYGDADSDFDADRIGRYGDDYYFIAATSNEANDSTGKSGSVNSNMFTDAAYGDDGLVAVSGQSTANGVAGLLKPNAGEYRTDIPVRNVYVNTSVRSITSPYGVALADGTQSKALFKGNGSGIAGFTFEVYTNETVYVTAYFAQEREYLVEGTTPYTFNIDVNLYKNTAFFDTAPTNVKTNANFAKTCTLVETAQVTGTNGAYVTFAISGKGIYFLAEDFTQYSTTGASALHVAPQALYVSTSLPEYSSIITTNLNGGEADIPTRFTADTDDIVLPTPVKTGYDFAGWKVNGVVVGMSYTIDCSKPGDISLEATWTAKKFTVSFAGERVDFEDVSVTWDEAYDLSALVPTRAGYTFAGWYYNSYPIPTIGTYDQVPSDITLTASWELATYDITVNLAGGTADEIADSYTIESSAIVLPTPTRVGYTFAGWKVNGAAAVMEYTIVTGSTGDIALEATWTINTYTITTTLNGGTATIPATYTVESEAIVLPTPVKAGYDFAGWKVNGAEPVASYTIPAGSTGDVALEATWTATVYDITLTLNGGTATIPATYTIESDAIVLPTPVKANYTFVGWKVNGANAVANYTIATGTTGDITLEAIWTAVEYDITVNLNGGTATIPATYTIEDVIVLPTPERTGYDFAGWKVNGADAVMSYTIENATGAIDLVATWTATVYDITLTLNGGTATIPATYTIESDAIVLPTPVKANYTFVGWKVNGANAVANYTIATGTTGDITLEAIWTAVEYDITVNLNGGTATIPATYTIEDVIVLPTPERTGYDFAGWKVNGADAVMSYTIENATGAIDLVATWTATVYDITLTLNGGTATIPATYTIESDAIVLPTPVKANYTFVGWKVNGANAVANYTIATGTTGDITLEAIWTATEYAINVVLGDGSLDASVVIPATYTVESAAIVIDAVPTLEGYNFLGWKVGDAEPVASYTIPAGSTGDITITAVYEEKPAAGCGGAIAMLSAFMGLIALAVVGKKY